MMNQYECIIATPRSNSACTLGSQEVGKLSLPSFSSCWPNGTAAQRRGDQTYDENQTPLFHVFLPQLVMA